MFVKLLQNLLGSAETDLNQLFSELEQIPGVGTIVSFIQNFRISLVPVGAVTAAQVNLLPVSGFPSGSIAENPVWSVSASSNDGTGSAQVTFDGTYKALRSGSSPDDVISVGAGQVITETIYCSHQTYSGVGDEAPIQLQLVPFTNGVPGTPVILDTYTPTTPDVGWPGHELTGSYTVPTGVTGIQTRIFITDGALTGTGNFDDAAVVQASTMPQGLIAGLEDDLSAIQSTAQSLMDAIASAARGIPIVGTEVSDVVTAIENFTPANVIGSLGSSTLGEDLAGIIGHLIDAIKGQPAGTTTAASLSDLYNAMNQALNNTAGSDVTVFNDTTTTVAIESWANQIDLVGVGKGQDGEQGFVLNDFGQGGQAGVINATSLIRGTHYDSGTANVAVTINDDGSVTLAVPAGTATSAHSITCAVGSGSQSPHFGTGYMGIGPGTFPYNGQNYACGGNQNTIGAAGLGPGGGGAGGLIGFGNGGAGGAGAPGGGWVRQLATAISGGSTGADVTPPTTPTVTFDSATLTTLTLTASGSTDE